MRQFILIYFRQRKKQNLLLLLFGVIFCVVFWLYQLPAVAVVYPILLLMLVWAVFTGIDMYKSYGRYTFFLSTSKKCGLELSGDMSADREPDRVVENPDWDMFQELLEKQEDSVDWECAFYRNAVSRLLSERRKQLDAIKMWNQDTVDYYTTWVHQIKTPIAAMRLMLQEDTEDSRKLSAELQRIEQYVEMVLTYLRLGSGETDYVFAQVDLDKLMRECIKKYAGQFIRRHLTLDYHTMDCQVLTDEKWLAFVVEQILSNALKYTRSGSVSIYMEPPCTLCIRDTGIGIAPEDLPRIFDKGYTGYNGRSDKKATGLGLYLCKQICDRLKHTITARSVPDEGTVVCIGLGREVLETE